MSNQGKATNGCEGGHNHGRDLTKGNTKYYLFIRCFIKFFIVQHRIYQQWHNSRENTFTKVITKRSRREKKNIFKVGVSPHTSLDSSNTKDGCKATGAQTGRSFSRVRSLSQLLLKGALRPFSPVSLYNRSSIMLTIR